jgi:hypothetical protein
MGQKGRLENWVVCHGNVLLGEIYDDNTGRFEDGYSIVISKLLPMAQQMSSPKEGVEVFTQNSTYLLGKVLNL